MIIHGGLVPSLTLSDARAGSLTLAQGGAYCKQTSFNLSVGISEFPLTGCSLTILFSYKVCAFSKPKVLPEGDSRASDSLICVFSGLPAGSLRGSQ